MQSKTDIATAGVLPPSRGSIIKFQWQDQVVYLFFLLVLVFFALTIGDKGFLTTENLFNITRSTSMIVVMAVAMTFVICCGELDLSVGSTAGLAALAAGYVLHAGYGSVAGIVAAILCGLAVGLLNGLLVTVFNIPSFLVTLGMMQLIRGLDMRVTYTKPIEITDDFFNNVFGSGSVGPLPSLFIWSILAAAIGHVVLRYTAFGREVLAAGGNRTAAEYSGVNTKRIKLYCFLITGVAAGLAGMLYSGMMQTARYNFGTGAELAVIAATILGGTSLFGGKGTILGTFVGALLIGTINNGLIIMGLDVSEQNMIAGAIIIVAVAFGRKPAR